MQYWLLVRDETAGAMAASSLKFFSFFTILTNILAAATLLVPLIAPQSSAGRFLARPSVRTAVTGYIIMVGVVYYLLLSDLSQRQGWPMFFEHMLHYVTPPLFVLDWLAFVPKRDLNWRVGLGAMGFPLVYLVWTLRARRRDRLVPVSVRRRRRARLPARASEHRRTGAGVPRPRGGAGRHRSRARAAHRPHDITPAQTARALAFASDRGRSTSPRSSRQGCR